MLRKKQKCTAMGEGKNEAFACIYTNTEEPGAHRGQRLVLRGEGRRIEGDGRRIEGEGRRIEGKGVADAIMHISLNLTGVSEQCKASPSYTESRRLAGLRPGSAPLARLCPGCL